MTQNPTNTDLAAALREIADTLPLGSQLIVRLAADRLGDGWIEWSGGCCPVAHEQMVEVKFRGTWPTMMGTVGPAGEYSWRHDRHAKSDIVAYRPVIAFMR